MDVYQDRTPAHSAQDAVSARPSVLPGQHGFALAGVVGNQPMGRLLAQFNSNATAGSAPAFDPRSVEWNRRITRQGSAVASAIFPRDPNGQIYTGDSYSVTARWSGTSPGNLAWSVRTGDGAAVSPESVMMEHADEASQSTMTVSFISAGTYVLSVRAPGGQPLKEFSLSVVTDVAQFRNRVNSASAALAARHIVAEKWFADCFNAYIDGYEKHKEVLKEAGESRAVANAALTTVLFGLAGGLVGGAVGGLLRKTMDKWRGPAEAATRLRDVGIGALTDGPKDLVKALAARMPEPWVRERLGDRGGETSGGAGPTGVLPSQSGAAASGAYLPAGIEPLKWHAAIDPMIKNDVAQLALVLSALHQAADWASARGDAATALQFDPVAIINNSTIGGYPIANLPPVPSFLAYEAEFWKAWLSEHAYLVNEPIHDAVDEEIEDRLYWVMLLLRGRGIDVPNDVKKWIDIYGAKSRKRAQDYRDAEDRANAPKFPGEDWAKADRRR